MKKLATIILSLLLILVLTASTGGRGSVLAQVDENQTEQIVCDETEKIAWVWGLLDITVEAPDFIYFIWPDGSEEQAAFYTYDPVNKIAYYRTTNNLNIEPAGWDSSEVSAEQLATLFYECPMPTATATPDMTVTPTSENVPTATPTVVPTNTAAPTDTPTVHTEDEENNNDIAPTATPTATLTPAQEDDDDYSDTLVQTESKTNSNSKEEVLGATTLPATSSGNRGLAVVVTGVFGLFVGFFLIAFHFALKLRKAYFHRPSNYVIYKKI